MPFRGFPLQIQNRSLTSVFVVQPTVGLDVSDNAADIQPGSTPESRNYVMREGALEPRPMLSKRDTNPQPFGTNPAVPIQGGMEVIDVVGNRFPLVSGTTRWAKYSTGAWSALSYVGAHIPAAAVNDYWDFTQIYYDSADENVAVGVHQSYQSLYIWQPDQVTFSTLTQAPRAVTVAAFDNFLLAANIRSGASDYVQRIQWSDRGSIQTWTGGLSGFEDLLAMRGDITRLITQENRIIVFGENEIWQGQRADFPYIFRFSPIDIGVGAPYPWTAVTTPKGILFLGRDYQVYILPKEGGQPQPVGQKLHRYIRNVIDQPQRAWAAYDSMLGMYQLYYPIKSGSGYPQRAVWASLEEGNWAPQDFDPVGGRLSLSRGFEINITSAATTWANLQSAGILWSALNMTWAELGGSSEGRVMLAGSSAGTLYYFNSAVTADAKSFSTDTGVPVRSLWQGHAMVGDVPARNKTVTKLTIDYQTDSASSVSVSISQNQGASFNASERVLLPSSSAMSQAYAYPYISARYPMFKVESEGFRYRLFRFLTEMRFGGR
jgi:hypothetical protein